jgi:L-alanine-DL-glutamate epimerase-like enolase superfamily enzyme
MNPLKVCTEIERWPLKKPFRISGYEFTAIEVLVVILEQEGHVGRGEAAGVYYKNDKPDSMLRQIRSVRAAIEAGVDRDSLRALLPPGGARNAVDCALWDLEAKLSGCFAWQLAALGQPGPVLTTFTCGADYPREMAATARGYTGARAIKIKLTGEASDVDRVHAVREARPDAWLGVDANQAFSRALLEKLMPVFVDARVALIEQPFPIGQDALLDGFQSPIPIAADESVQSSSDVGGLSGRFNVVNIKLDKCGGLTEALIMARVARDAGLELMVGNMIGTSLAMAPAFLVGQLCQVADLDGPIFLTADRRYPVQYADGLLTCPDELWGGMQ